MRKKSEEAEKWSKTEEAKKWSKQKPTADSAVKFAITFLHLHKSADDGEVPLDVYDESRLTDIVRAVSWVESRHGTGTGARPARDPMQCGNPGDPWWRELTGQTGDDCATFTRGPDRKPKQIRSNKLAAVADKDGAFDKRASLKKLGSYVKEGHGATTFKKYHSYYWGTLHLLHKLNGAKTYLCDHLKPKDLVDAAVRYNGGGDLLYQSRIEKALDLFDAFGRSFVGVWSTNWGNLSFEEARREEGKIEGCYSYNDASGTVKGKKYFGELTAEWEEKNSSGKSAAGTAELTLDDYGKTFKGPWRLTSGEAATTGGEWTGTRNSGNI